jgi:hypothetical protein
MEGYSSSLYTCLGEANQSIRGECRRMVVRSILRPLLPNFPHMSRLAPSRSNKMKPYTLTPSINPFCSQSSAPIQLSASLTAIANVGHCVESGAIRGSRMDVDRDVVFWYHKSFSSSQRCPQSPRTYRLQASMASLFKVNFRPLQSLRVKWLEVFPVMKISLVGSSPRRGVVFALGGIVTMAGPGALVRSRKTHSTKVFGKA